MKASVPTRAKSAVHFHAKVEETEDTGVARFRRSATYAFQIQLFAIHQLSLATQSVPPCSNQTPRIVRVPRPRPEKQPPEPLLPRKRSFSLHGSDIIVTHKPAPCTQTPRRHDLLVKPDLRPWSRQIPILEHPILAPATGVLIPRLRRTEERAAVARHTQHDLLRRHALQAYILHGRGAGNASGVAGGVPGRVQLGLVSALRGPGSGEIVRHDVDVVQERRSLAEIDILQRPGAGW